MKRITIAALILLTLFLGVITMWLVSIRPWQSKVLAHGFSPDGREYCVVQTFKDLIEPYQVSFYIRDKEGIWRWNYLEHEDDGWKSATVVFSGETAQIQRDGVLFKEFALPTDKVDLSKVLRGYSHHYCESGFSVDDIFTFHNHRYN